jgi:hypothetical protein
MHHGRLASFLLGAWLAGSVLMLWIATQSLGVVDEAMSSPPEAASNIVKTLGKDNARALLRYSAGEQNRFLFEGWELAQMALAVALILVLILGLKSRLSAGLTAGMLLLVIFAHFRITADLALLGKNIEFTPWVTESLERDQFWRLHAVYSAIEAGKLLLGAALGVLLFKMRRHRTQTSKHGF